MTHHARELFERELSQLDWSHGRSRLGILEHFRMAPTLRTMLERHLPDVTFRSAADVLSAIPTSGWDQIERAFQQGPSTSHFRESRAGQGDLKGQTSGWGHILGEEHSKETPLDY